MLELVEELMRSPYSRQGDDGCIHVQEGADMDMICMEIFLIGMNNDYDTINVASMNPVEL